MHRRARQLLEFRRSFVPLLRRFKTTSFSQYGEDVLLRQLLPQERGFYIDVGAGHPWEHSNTYRLYLRGWSGITVEPNVSAAALFKRMRPRDTHLTLGISATASQLTYYRFKDPFLNTFDGNRLAKPQGDPVDQVAVDCTPLRQVVSTYCPDALIDLLSVDCEGLDYEVLASLDWDVSRPSVIIVEDFQQFFAVGRDSTPSRLRTYLQDLDYAPVAQCIFSFIYVDTTAFRQPGRSTGFRLDQSQVRGLRRKSAADLRAKATDSAVPLDQHQERPTSGGGG